MTIFSGGQLRSLAASVGFTGDNLTIAVAVALAESSGNSDATNVNSDGSIDRGLWQVNSVHAQYDAKQLFDPTYNAKAAYAISSNGTNWQPWSTYNNGAYLKYMNQSTATNTGSLFNWVVARSYGPYSSACDPANDLPHYARDVHNQKGDVLTSLVPGKVVSINNKGDAGGGIGTLIFIQPSAYPSTVDSKYPVQGIPQLQWYCYHFLPGTAVVKEGDTVKTGDTLAQCGYYPGGYSYYTHTHTGWFDGTYPVSNCPAMGGRPHGPDIGPFLDQIKSGGGVTITQSSGGVNQTTSQVVSTAYTSVADIAKQTLNNVPGFLGIVESLDESEQFQPFRMQGQTTDYNLFTVNAGGIGITQLPQEAVSASILFITSNTPPVLIRGSLILLGLVILIALIQNAVQMGG
jgi:biotin carboxyl carrier protein